MKTATQGQYLPLLSKRLSQKLIPDLKELVKKKMMEIIEKVDSMAFTSDIWTADHTKQSCQFHHPSLVMKLPPKFCLCCQKNKNE